jgi:hypothetical protein
MKQIKKQTRNACIEMLEPGRGTITFYGKMGSEEFSSKLRARRIVESAALSSIISFDEWNQLIEKIYRLDLPEQPPIEDILREGRWLKYEWTIDDRDCSICRGKVSFCFN